MQAVNHAFKAIAVLVLLMPTIASGQFVNWVTGEDPRPALMGASAAHFYDALVKGERFDQVNGIYRIHGVGGLGRDLDMIHLVRIIGQGVEARNLAVSARLNDTNNHLSQLNTHLSQQITLQKMELDATKRALAEQTTALNAAIERLKTLECAVHSPAVDCAQK